MKELTETQQTFKVELTLDEVEYIRGITQNYMGNPSDETLEERSTRLSLFVGSSRLLGYKMNDDGSINRDCIGTP